MRLVQALCVKFGWTICQGDAVAAFLLALMDKKVYTVQPKGYHVGVASKVALLIKAMFGLKQSPLLFWRLVIKLGLELGFIQCDGDECLFSAIFEGKLVLLVVYVDDFILCGEKWGVDFYFARMSSRIEIDDRGYLEPGKLSTLLGVAVTVDESGDLHLSLDRSMAVKKFFKSHFV